MIDVFDNVEVSAATRGRGRRLKVGSRGVVVLVDVALDEDKIGLVGIVVVETGLVGIVMVDIGLVGIAIFVVTLRFFSIRPLCTPIFLELLVSILLALVFDLRFLVPSFRFLVKVGRCHSDSLL